MVAGPDWKGDTPAGIKKVFRSETQFGLIGYRTQLFGPKDMPNVVKIQAGYKVQPLSQFLKQPAPPAAPAIDWPPFTKDDMKAPFAKYLNFILQFCPPVAGGEGAACQVRDDRHRGGQAFRLRQALRGAQGGVRCSVSKKATTRS